MNRLTTPPATIIYSLLLSVFLPCIALCQDGGIFRIKPLTDKLSDSAIRLVLKMTPKTNGIFIDFTDDNTFFSQGNKNINNEKFVLLLNQNQDAKKYWRRANKNLIKGYSLALLGFGLIVTGIRQMQIANDKDNNMSGYYDWGGYENRLLAALAFLGASITIPVGVFQFKKSKRMRYRALDAFNESLLNPYPSQ